MINTLYISQSKVTLDNLLTVAYVVKELQLKRMPVIIFTYLSLSPLPNEEVDSKVFPLDC